MQYDMRVIIETVILLTEGNPPPPPELLQDFRENVIESGNLSNDFLQGTLLGMMMAHSYAYDYDGPEGTTTKLLRDNMTALAHIYLERLDGVS